MPSFIDQNRNGFYDCSSCFSRRILGYKLSVPGFGLRVDVKCFPQSYRRMSKARSKPLIKLFQANGPMEETMDHLLQNTGKA